MAEQSGAMVRRARVARGLTQDELARRAGLSRQALGAIESGAYQPGNRASSPRAINIAAGAGPRGKTVTTSARLRARIRPASS